MNFLIKKLLNKQYTIGPKIKTPGGISVGRSFILHEGISFDDAISKIKTILIKCTWIDSDNKEQVDYIKLNIKNELPSAK